MRLKPSIEVGAAMAKSLGQAWLTPLAQPSHKHRSPIDAIVILVVGCPGARFRSPQDVSR
jgi:hypothetical protein